MHHTSEPTKHLHGIKADMFRLEEYQPNGYPDLVLSSNPGPWMRIGVLSGDTTHEMTLEERQQGNAYMLKRIRLALTWLEVMEQTGLVNDDIINSFTKMHTINPAPISNPNA